MRSFIVAALALAGAAVAASANNGTVDMFQLHPDGALGIDGWAIVNSPITPGKNSIQIQRPAAYQSDLVYLHGDFLSFRLKGPTEYGIHVPHVPYGNIVPVTSAIGKRTAGFSITEQNLIEFKGSLDGFWACPIHDNYNLFYGLQPESHKLPSQKCTPLILSASPVSV
ncbi:hypothetical protein GGS21DRAFT_544433 [Xylaria nigripes]|nr:hypothetical protein GGS21DRAFT_544433 [Xylaria nigripes]